MVDALYALPAKSSHHPHTSLAQLSMIQSPPGYPSTMSFSGGGSSTGSETSTAAGAETVAVAFLLFAFFSSSDPGNGGLALLFSSSARPASLLISSRVSFSPKRSA